MSKHNQTNQKKRNDLLFFLQLFYLIAPLVSIFITSYYYYSVKILIKTSFISNAQAVGSSFTFTAAGDFGAKTATNKVLDGMNPATSGADFALALGDLSYGQIIPESAWCTYVQNHVGALHPFSIVAGNHEDGTTANISGTIDNFKACLPDRIGVTGNYGREYYFDYPAGTPLARFIVISPNIQFTDEPVYTYKAGTTHYNWLVNAIDSARAANIPWVITGMHKNCITMGQKNCSIDPTLWNFLISKKVDLILQGHEHNYQRSKQFALSSSCTAMSGGSFNANCIVDDGADRLYSKGAGSVLAITGTGGTGVYTISTTRPEAGYFAAYMGKNSNPSNGLLKVNVSASSLDGQFISTSGTFSDSFMIVGFTPTPTPTNSPTLTPPNPGDPTWTPTPTPTDTPTPTPTTMVPTPTPTTGGSQVQEITLGSSEDAFVESDTPTTNYGSRSAVSVDASPVKIGYMKFDLSVLAGKSVIGATLRVKTTNAASTSNNIKLVDDNSWSESTINYNNKPPLGSVVNTVLAAPAGSWNDIDVTTGVIAKQGGIMSLGFDKPGTDSWGFNSKDTSVTTDRPQLVISYQ